AEAELHDKVAARRLEGVLGIVAGANRGPPRPVVGPHVGVVLLDLIPARDAEIALALADKGRYVGGRQEDERDGQVLDVRNVEAVLAAELHIGDGGRSGGFVLTHSWAPRTGGGLLGFPSPSAFLVPSSSWHGFHGVDDEKRERGEDGEGEREGAKWSAARPEKLVPIVLPMRSSVVA
ncbi:hypothetical protein BN1708_015898, partial [Verticillium longisporum]